MMLIARRTTQSHEDPNVRIRAAIRKLFEEAEDRASRNEIDREAVDFAEAVARHERTLIEEALRKTHGDQAKAAEVLQISPARLAEKIRAHQVRGSGPIDRPRQ